MWMICHRYEEGPGAFSDWKFYGLLSNYSDAANIADRESQDTVCGWLIVWTGADELPAFINDRVCWYRPYYPGRSPGPLANYPAKRA